MYSIRYTACIGCILYSHSPSRTFLPCLWNAVSLISTPLIQSCCFFFQLLLESGNVQLRPDETSRWFVSFPATPPVASGGQCSPHSRHLRRHCEAGAEEEQGEEGGGRPPPPSRFFLLLLLTRFSCLKPRPPPPSRTHLGAIRARISLAPLSLRGNCLSEEMGSFEDRRKVVDGRRRRRRDQTCPASQQLV